MAQRKLEELQKRADDLTPAEQIELASYLLEQARKRQNDQEANGEALMRFYGKVHFEGNPVDIQREMRSEWAN